MSGMAGRFHCDRRLGGCDERDCRVELQTEVWRLYCSAWRPKRRALTDDRRVVRQLPAPERHSSLARVMGLRWLRLSQESGDSELFALDQDRADPLWRVGCRGTVGRAFQPLEPSLQSRRLDRPAGGLCRS